MGFHGSVYLIEEDEHQNDLWALNYVHTYIVSSFDLMVKAPKHPFMSTVLLENFFKFVLFYWLVDRFYKQITYGRRLFTVKAAQEVHWWWLQPDWASSAIVFGIFTAIYFWVFQHNASISFGLAVSAALPFDAWITLYLISFFSGHFVLLYINRRFFKRIFYRYRIWQ